MAATDGRCVSAANMTLERRRVAIGIVCGEVAEGECKAEVNGDVGWAEHGLFSGLLSVDEEEDLKRLLKENGLRVSTTAGLLLGAEDMNDVDNEFGWYWMFSLPNCVWFRPVFVLG